MNVASVLEHQALLRGDAVALVDGRRAMTFAQLNEAAARAATELAAAGVRAGDRALVFCPMSIDLYLTLIAILRVGAAAVFVDPASGWGRIDACCERVGPRAFVAVSTAHLLRLVSPRIRRLPVKIAIGGGVPGTRCMCTSQQHAGSLAPIEPRAPTAPALITCTSGSTGQPKVAVRTHGLLIAQHAAIARELELAPGAVDVTTLPMFVLANLASGVTSVIPDADARSPGAARPERLLERVRGTKATRIAASPAVFERLVEHLAASGQQLDVDRIFTGGAPVFPALLDALAAWAPHAAITAVYGSTEAEPIARLRREELTVEDRRRMRAGAGLPAGLPVASISVRIVADRWGTPVGPFDPAAFDAEAFPVGRPGEIVVCGDHVLPAYLDGRGDTETKIHAGDRVWHRTGDAGYLDGEGRLWLLGRCSARIDDDRGTIYPFAVECAASDVPGVRRTALVRHDGCRLLLVELHASARTQALAALREELAWAHLDELRVVQAIPVDRRHNAKVDYPAVEQMLRRGRRVFRAFRPLLRPPSPHAP